MTWRYEWNGQNWVEGAFVLTSSSYFAYDGTSSTSDLWYCPTTVRRTLSSGNIEEYEAGTLYKWEIDRWIAIASTKNDVMARALGQVRQTAKDFSIQFNNLSGDFSLY